MTTTSLTLADIYIYPIKSTAGISLSNAWVDEYGLSFDRRFVLSTPCGTFITARTKPSLALVQANLTATGIVLTAPNMPPLTIHYQTLSKQYQNVTVWRDEVSAELALSEHHQWFSDYLQTPCQLLFFGEKSSRYVKNNNKQVAFADGYPLLVISQASLDKLNQLSPRNNTMAQFRPNLVIENCLPFAEDSWQKIKIGEVEFEISKPCSRCIFTTIEPQTGEFDKTREPLATLAKFRKGQDNEIYFGQNLIALNQGQIKVGDRIEVIATKTPAYYPDNRQTSASNKTNEEIVAKVNIRFESWDLNHQGNTKETLLEQGEDAGLIMPYSCRGGNCGRCKVKLNSGEVTQLTTDGLMPQEIEQGYILACSSIPKSDLVVSKD